MSEDKAFIEEDIKKKLERLWLKRLVEYGNRILSDNFKPKQELRELQIYKESLQISADISIEIMKEVL